MKIRKAVVVGIDKYSDSPLEGCVSDATSMSEAVSRKPLSFDVDLILDEDATRVRLRRALEDLSITDGDALFYFAGHGAGTPLGTYLVAVDSLDCEEGIDLDWLRRVVALHKSPPHLFLVILDCCHAGSAKLRRRDNESVLTASGLKDALEVSGEGCVVLAACRADQSAKETEAGDHGEFTAAILQGLSGDAANGDGEITIFSLYDYVSRRFEGDRSQSPVFRGDTTGRIVIGAGYSPVSRQSVDSALLDKLSAEAEGHLRRYHQKYSSLDVAQFRSYGYRQACDALAPILDWFQRKQQTVQGLSVHKPFREQYSAAQSHHQSLASLHVGLETRYGRVKQYLGGGTFGGVWQVSDTEHADRVIKVYHGHDLPNKDKLIRFRRGYDAMRQLDHPHIVRVYEFSDCPVAFLMNFVDGPNLRTFHTASVEPSELIRILLLVAETVQHAHGRDVVHRDIKPENIIMNYEQGGGWIPYLTDFDLAWFSTATQVTKEAMGTLFYAAPEQLAKPTSQVAHAPTTDVYSFGQLLFFLLTGGDPVPLKQADNRRALVERLSYGYSQEAGQRIMKLYAGCVETDPAKRFESMRRICDKLAQIHQRLTTLDAVSQIPLSQFLAELHYSLVGLVPTDVDHVSYASLSRRTQVTVSTRESKTDGLALEVHLVPIRGMFEGGSNEAGRISINNRIDAALKKFRDVRRRSGKQGVFEVYIDVDNLALNLLGVEKCFKIISRAIDAMER